MRNNADPAENLWARSENAGVRCWTSRGGEDQVHVDYRPNESETCAPERQEPLRHDAMPNGAYKPPSRPGSGVEERNVDGVFGRLHTILTESWQNPLHFAAIMLFSSIAVALGAVALARAQANEPGPRGVVIEGDYTGPLRPQIHYSPPSGFMNDPNGMFVDSTGVWHLYYQCTLIHSSIAA